MNVFPITLGCKVNQYETQAMLNQLAAAGFTTHENDENADIVLINSCTVTSTSDQKVRQTLRRARRQHPDAVIILTGCMPQAFPELAESFLETDIVLGNSNRAALVPHLLQFLSSHQRIIDIVPHKDGSAFEKLSVNNFYERTRAFVKIEDGCNRFCSYCIIPYARGRVRSKPLEELRQELASIGAKGYREVVLTGINLSAYGQDFGSHLCNAVEVACSIQDLLRVRLGSLEPEQLNPEVIAKLAKQEKLCPQFHLSLQSGCNTTLKRMNRHYTAEEYYEIVENLRSAFQNAAITTDIMVGFPGETDEEFQSSLAFAQKVGFAKAHVFVYSKRPGTRANDMPNQLTNVVKEERSRKMIETTLASKQAFFHSQIDFVEQVLFERECQAGIYEGYTQNYTPVHVKSDQPLSGEIKHVKIMDADIEWCNGTLMPESLF